MSKDSPSTLGADQNATDEDHNMITLYQMLMKKWWLLLIVGLISAAAGFFYAASVPPQYESRLTFSLDASAGNGGLAGAMNLAAQFGFGMGAGQSMFDGDNILEIMKSRRMVEKVLLSSDTFYGKNTTFADFYMQISGMKEKLAQNKRLAGISFPVGVEKGQLSYLQDSILFNIYQTFSRQFIAASRPDKKLSIYEIRFSSLNEQFSKVFTDRLVNATSDFYIEITSKKDRETLEVLEQRVASLKSNVGGAIDTKAGTQDANVNPAFAAAQSPIVKQQYNMQAYGEAYKEMFKTLEIARYQYLKQIPLLQIIDRADYPMKRIVAGKIKTAFFFSLFAVLICMLMLIVMRFFKQRKATLNR